MNRKSCAHFQVWGAFATQTGFWVRPGTYGFQPAECFGHCLGLIGQAQAGVPKMRLAVVAAAFAATVAWAEVAAAVEAGAEVTAATELTPRLGAWQLPAVEFQAGFELAATADQCELTPISTSLLC